MKEVSTGDYLPLRLTSDTSNYYKLYKIKTPVDELISISLENIGHNGYRNYKWERKALPAINYKDLEGVIYNQETIRGKILVLDFWFIHCTKCVAEMPNLNKLVNQYKDRSDILFLSIAFDKEAELKKFLSNRTFKYAVVSDTLSYLGKELAVRSYPTSEIINKGGKIVKILNSYGDTYNILTSILSEEVSNVNAINKN